MNTTPPDEASRTLGQRLRLARLQQGLSEHALAQPEFTGNFVQALEQGRAHPSPQALAVLAHRLRLHLADLLPLATAMPPDPDHAALEEDLAYQLDHARILIFTQQGAAALQIINTAEQSYQPYLAHFCAAIRCRFYRLRGRAYLRVSDPTQARPDLLQALALAEQLHDMQEIVRAWNALGEGCFQEGRTAAARELHLQCAHAVHVGTIRDLNLRLSIAINLANDYWALNDMPQAIGMYQEALRLLQDVNNSEEAARVHWGLSRAYLARRELDRAMIYALQALDHYEAGTNRASTGTMCAYLAAIMIQRQEYYAAECWLERAKLLLEGTGRPALLCPIYERYATLELRRGQITQASVHAYRSLQLGQHAMDQPHKPPNTIPQVYAVQMLARALRTVGLVEEQQGRLALADDYFQQAITLVQQNAYPETAFEIERDYAEVLRARGAYIQATAHYQAALQYRAGGSCAQQPPHFI